MGGQIRILTIRMDLPFARKRWYSAAPVNHVQTLCDYREAQFGQSYGPLIKELRLLARAVLVLDKPGTVRYVELVRELATEPDYDAALKAARTLL